MATVELNHVVLTGNLTSDPELRELPGGATVCKLRIGSSTTRKDTATDEYVEKPNYFDVVVWGANGENAAQYLSKGRPVAVTGRLQWREWETSNGEGKRERIEIIADTVKFLGVAPAETPAAA